MTGGPGNHPAVLFGPRKGPSRSGPQKYSQFPHFFIAARFSNDRESHTVPGVVFPSGSSGDGAWLSIKARHCLGESPRGNGTRHALLASL
jgi:hypothetical protein